MDPSTIAVILNPRSGAGKGLRAIPKVTDALQRLGRPFHLHVTSRAGEAPDVANDLALKGARLILAVGGDGTINEVANGVLASGAPAAVGVVATGHGCDFVRTAGTPKEIAAAVAHACTSQTRQIDVGKATFADGASRYFVNVAGLGFDAAVAERAMHSRLPGAQLPYLTALFASLARYRNIRVSVTADGATESHVAVFVTIANAKYFGGGLMITPMAELTDGLLDLAVIGDFKKPELIKQIPSVYKGKHITHPKFSHRRAREIHVESVEPTRVQLDGELAGSAPVTFSVVPGALSLAG